jgi:hypothetical protein
MASCLLVWARKKMPWARKKRPAASVCKPSEPQFSQFENGHPGNHQDGHVSTTTPESMLSPVPALNHYVPPMPVGDGRAEHPVSANMLEDKHTYISGPPAAASLVNASASTSCVPCASPDNGVVPASHMLSDSNALDSVKTIQPSTASLALLKPADFLTKQLDYMHKQGVLLRGRYRILGSSEQRSGGQGVVRFAIHDLNTKEFAVKFFLDRDNFKKEEELYTNRSLQHIFPPTDEVSSNDLEPHVLDRPLPPMIVTERGESLDEWAHRSKPDFFMCFTMAGHLARQVMKIHDAGLVHRDLKPSNVIWLQSLNQFTVIDFGSAAKDGEEADISTSLAYAAPEVVVALEKGEKRMLVTGALDVWSLGVMFYETFTGVRMLSCSRDIYAAAAGQVKYPWEDQDDPSYRDHMRRLGIVKDIILAMLRRDDRITMTEMFSNFKKRLKPETTTKGTD